MTEPDQQPFERDVFVDKPGIVGARWWHRSLVDESRTVARRSVVKGLAVAGGGIAALAMLGATIGSLGGGSREKVSLEKRRSLSMQKQYGWDFGARGVELVFDGRSEAPFVRSDLASLAAVMTPARYAKYHAATLPAALYAQPAETLPDPPDGSPRADAGLFRPLADVVVPIVTPAMQRAYRVGQALARLTAGVPGIAVLADLPGPQAVAVAAGAAERFEPVLLFDNWPHPHGVVPSHLTLGALAYYQPRFAERAADRKEPLPLFLLDRARLSPYSEESDRFDNRYYPRVPPLSALARDGVALLLYLVGSEGDLPEPDDLNDALAGDPAAAGSPGVAVRALALTDFGDGDLGGQAAPMHYGGSAETDESFWVNYPFWPAFRQKGFQVVASSSTKDYRVSPRPSTRPAPQSFGHVAVAVTATGLLVAAALDRRGSMNRFSGGWGG